MTVAIVVFGFAFGLLMQHAGVNRNDTIIGLAVLEDFTVAKVMGLAIGIGVLLISFEVELGLASYHIKPVILGGLIWGGLLFGARMAGGCTSGLILSGGMQLAKSGLIFAAFVFISFILTGKLFYSAKPG